MPNHFHFMLVPNQKGCEKVKSDSSLTQLQNLSKAIGKTLSSYTQAINKRNGTVGALFQKKTKAKSLFQEFPRISNCSLQDYVTNCFHYIHLNPLQANLVNHLSQWPYSSWLDYYGFRNGSLCNKKLFMELLNLSEQDFKLPMPSKIDDKIARSLF